MDIACCAPMKARGGRKGGVGAALGAAYLRGGEDARFWRRE